MPVKPTDQALARRRRNGWIAVTTAILFVASACGGSAMSPAQVRAANEAVNGGVGGATTTADSSVTSAGPSAASSAVAGAAAGAAAGPGAAKKAAGTGAAATAGLTVGNCNGFQNGPGITDTTITIGNAADISGPIPGIFTSAQQAVKAYVAYFNATSNICGRKLALTTQDSRSDPGADQVAYQNLCSSSFAAIGSMSAFDSGGAQTAQGCGLPDIRTATTTDERAACSTCFGAQGANAHFYENAPMTHFFNQDPSLKQHVAIAYINAGGATENALTLQSVAQKLGATNISMQAMNVSDLSYDSYVQSMKSAGVQYVIYLGAYQFTVKLQQSMKTNGFTPKVFVQDPTIYDPGYVSQAGGAGVGEGTYVYSNFLPFSLASTNKEESNYLTWLQQVAPGANPTFYGAWAWSATALFVQEAVKLGGGLNRGALVNDLKGVHNWTTNGMTAPQDVGAKINGSCWRFLQLHNSTWQSLSDYECDGVTAK